MDANGKVEGWRLDARVTSYPPNGQGPQIPLGQSIGNAIELGLNWQQIKVGPAQLVKMGLPVPPQIVTRASLFDQHTAMALAHWLLSNYRSQSVEAQVQRVWIMFQFTEQPTGDDPVLING